MTKHNRSKYLPEMLEDDPLGPLLPKPPMPESWSTWMVLGLGLEDRPAVLVERSLGTGRALTGSGIRPCK